MAVLCALQAGYYEHTLLRRSGALLIEHFFVSSATLRKDFTQAYEWCVNKLKHIKTDWEGAACGLFKAYPLYPKEPLLMLIKSGVFIEEDGDEYTADKCAYKFALFVLLASEADYKSKLDCWSKYRNGDTVYKSDATQMIRYLF